MVIRQKRFFGGGLKGEIQRLLRNIGCRQKIDRSSDKVGVQKTCAKVPSGRK